METHRRRILTAPLSKVGAFCAAFLCASTAFSQEANTDKVAAEEIIDAQRSDPLESFNRAMWDFNQNYLDKYVARPAAIFYRDYIPVPAQNSIYNFAKNFEEPSTMVNNALQGNVEDSGNEAVNLRQAMRNDMNEETGLPSYSPLVAVALMVFYVFAAQCMATFAIVRQETNSWKWPLFMVGYMTVLAYFGALVVYQGGKFMGFA